MQKKVKGMVCRLKDIAAALNISANTVSCALKGTGKMSDELRARIKRKAAEMGYVSNLSASALRTGFSKAIAIVYDNNFNPYYSIMTGLLQKRFSVEKYDVMIFSDWSHRGLLSADMVRQMLARGIDGIVSFLDAEEEAYDLIESTGKKLFILGRESKRPGVETVLTDDETGAYIATKYLIENGHRNILYFTVKLSISCAQRRLDGHRRALAEAKIPFREENVLCIGSDGGSGREMVMTAAARKLSYTAIFCFNDMFALASMMQLGEYGIRVPEDISVIGYDHVESHYFLPIGLTTIDTDKVGMADMAVRKMVAMLEGKEEPQTALAPPRLIVGKTVAKIG